ncbi:MAG: hypothetical protein ACLGH0_11405 [Thermoanaerobaculia bacterium]
MASRLLVKIADVSVYERVEQLRAAFANGLRIGSLEMQHIPQERRLERERLADDLRSSLRTDDVTMTVRLDPKIEVFVQDHSVTPRDFRMLAFV